MASVLILSSTNRNFPSDVEDILQSCPFDSHRYDSLDGFLASPMRLRPFVAIFEIGSAEDLDRATVAREWVEQMQPEVPVKVIAIFSHKNLPMGEKQKKIALSDILFFPLSAKNLVFKIDLHISLLNKENHSTIKKNHRGFMLLNEEDVATQKEKSRVIRILGPSNQEGHWNAEDETPQGKIRWRWIRNEKIEIPEALREISWVVQSKKAPQYEKTTATWEVNDPETSLICLQKNEVLFTATAKKIIDNQKESQQEVVEQIKQEKLEDNSVTQNTAASMGAPKAAQTNKPVETKPTQTQILNAAKIQNEPSNEKENILLKSPSLSLEQNNVIAQEEASGAVSSSAMQADQHDELNNKTAKEQHTQNPHLSAIKSADKNSQKTNPTSKFLEQEKEKPAANEIALQKENLKHESTSNISSTTRVNIPLTQKHSLPLEEKNHQTRIVTQDLVPQQEEIKDNYEHEDKNKKIQNEISAHINKYQSPPQDKNQIEKMPAQPTDSASLNGTPKSTQLPNTQNAQKLSSVEANEQKMQASKPAEQSNALQKKKPQEILGKSSQSHKVNENDSDNIKETEESQFSTEFSKVKSFTPIELRENTRITHSQPTKEEKKVISAGSSVPASQEQSLPNTPQENEGSENYLKKRHYITLTLEELQDQNSSWHPVDKARVYLSAHHRYFGVKQIEDLFPIWIYEGELAPEFLEQHKAWKFYDRAPDYYSSLADMPEHLMKPLKILAGMKETQDIAPVTQKQTGAGSIDVMEKPAANLNAAPARKKNPFTQFLAWIAKLFWRKE